MSPENKNKFWQHQPPFSKAYTLKMTLCRLKHEGGYNKYILTKL